MSENKHQILNWYNSLLFRIPVVFLLLFAVLIISVTIAMKTVGKTRLEEQAYQLVKQTGNTIVTDVYSRVVFAESLVKSLANIAEQLPPDADTYIKIVPNIINIKGTESFIAGGGIWPEPYKFSKNTERRSFFWGRDKNGRLRYYDNYNDPNGSGYHSREWYVPAKHIDDDRDFWSQSYMDPYSYQPMVTCTAPIYRDNEFYGTATIDYKLEGLGKFLEQASTRLGGYSFVVDRNGKFLSFPNEALVKIYPIDKAGNKTEEFIYADALAEKQPLFAPIAKAISQVNIEIKEKAAQASNGQFNTQLASELDKESCQINRQEAEMITAAMTYPLGNMNNDYLLKQIKINKDIILGKSCGVFIFHVPHTYWKVVTVIPIQQAVAASTSIYRLILLLIVGIITVVMLIGFIFLYNSFIRPLYSMTKQIQATVKSNAEIPGQINITNRDELGWLAYWFNQRSAQLASTLSALRETQGSLEKKVQERTAELQTANQELKNFVYIASHDLREPLRTISSFGTLLEKSLKGNLNPDDAQSLHYMIDGAKRMGQMIEGLLCYSRISTKGREFEKVELNNIINELKQYELNVLIRETQTIINVPRKLPTVAADPIQVRQLLQNLIINGIKYQPKGNRPKITITSRPDADNMTRIEVTDNGIGIAPAYHSAIFAMFKRLHNKREYEGAGIGLAVCQKIIQRHNGKIGVESQPGKGATFWFTLPAENSEENINTNTQLTGKI